MTYQYLFDNKEFLKFIIANDDRVSSCDMQCDYCDPIYIGNSYYPTYQSNQQSKYQSNSHCDSRYLVIPSLHDAFPLIESTIYSLHNQQILANNDEYDLLCPIFYFNPFYNPEKEVIIDFKVVALWVDDVSNVIEYIQIALYKGIIVSQYC